METARRIDASPFKSGSTTELLSTRIERIQRDLWQANAEQVAAYTKALGDLIEIAESLSENPYQSDGLRNHARIFAKTVVAEVSIVKGIQHRLSSGSAEALVKAQPRTATASAAMIDTRCENVDLVADAPYHGLMPPRAQGDFTGAAGGNHEQI